MITYKEKEFRNNAEYTFYRDNKIIGFYDAGDDEFVFYTRVSPKELIQMLKIIGDYQNE